VKLYWCYALEGGVFELVRPRRFPLSRRSERAWSAFSALWPIPWLLNIPWLFFNTSLPNWYHYGLVVSTGCVSIAALSWYVFSRTCDMRGATRPIVSEASQQAIADVLPEA
jgi:hypothetical protein